MHFKPDSNMHQTMLRLVFPCIPRSLENTAYKGFNRG